MNPTITCLPCTQRACPWLSIGSGSRSPTLHLPVCHTYCYYSTLTFFPGWYYRFPHHAHTFVSYCMPTPACSPITYCPLQFTVALPRYPPLYLDTTHMRGFLFTVYIATLHIAHTYACLHSLPPPPGSPYLPLHIHTCTFLPLAPYPFCTCCLYHTYIVLVPWFLPLDCAAPYLPLYLCYITVTVYGHALYNYSYFGLLPAHT